MMCIYTIMMVNNSIWYGFVYVMSIYHFIVHSLPHSPGNKQSVDLINVRASGKQQHE